MRPLLEQSYYEILEVSPAVDPGALQRAYVIARFKPHLIMNLVRSSEEVRLGFSVRSVCRKYFGIDVDYVGYVNYDDCAWQSVRERRPLVLAYPQSDGARYLRRIAKKLLGD